MSGTTIITACKECGLVQEYYVAAHTSPTRMLETARCSGCGRAALVAQGAIPTAASHNKQSLYFDSPMLAEITAEAKRTDRSLSWIMQRAWRHARRHIQTLPSDTPAVPRGETHAEAAE